MAQHDAIATPGWRRSTATLTMFVGLGLFAIAAFAVGGGWYYDDEISNIHFAAIDFASIIRRANSEDVHPPGQYVIDKILFQTFRDWRLVKLAGGALQAAAIAFFFAQLSANIAPRARCLTAALLASAATMVMWGASLRWYAYFNPLFIIAAGLTLFGKRNLATMLALAIVSVGLFYIAYAAFVAIPALWLVYILRCLDYRWPNRGDRNFLIKISFVLLSILLMIFPQILIFLSVHMHNSDGQQGRVINSLAGVAYTLVLGNAVFPAAIFAIAAGIVIAVSAIIWLPGLLRDPLYRDVALLLLMSGLLLVVSGLGSKFRNAVFLYPLSLILLGGLLARMRSRTLLLSLLVIAPFQLIGIGDVIFHRNTSKGSYNQPYRDVLDRLAESKATCPSQTVVFNHDVVLTYLLENEGYSVSSPYALSPVARMDVTAGACVVVVHSSAGALPQADFERYEAFSGGSEPPLLSRVTIGLDQFAQIKRKLGGITPDYYFTVDVYYAKQNMNIPGWRFAAAQQ